VTSTEAVRRPGRVAIALAVLMAGVMVGLGVWAIVEGHHVAATKRGEIISLDGETARWMGGVQICIGMLPLMLAMPSKRAVVRWALIWLALGTACFVMALRTR
jgi:uncharacterized membrane protein YgdD (TMEM256/DUF423 family)